MQYRINFLMMAFSVLLTNASFAQGPVGDEVMVTLDRTVEVGSQSLPAGKYTIRQVTSASNPRVLEFTSDNGTKLDATVTAIPVLQNTPPGKTRVILDNEGTQSRLSKIWVQGKSYGYEFPGKSGSTSAINAVSLEGRYIASAPAQTVAASAPPATPAAAARPMSPSPTTTPSDNTVVAQNRTLQPPATTTPPEPQVTQAPSAQPSSQASVADNNQSAAADTTPRVPATALGWVQFALLGLAMASVGFFLYWRERSRR